MKNYILNKIAPSPKVRYCSQTIYESLLGCIRMYEVTREDKWKRRAGKVLDILIKIQRPDGGFDIGYDFNFGMLHKKGDSTSPELVGLLALTDYAKVFNEKEYIKPYADKAAEWIKKFAIKLDEVEYAIPYSPYTTNEIMVYNGTSFACGALGYYLGIFENEDKYLREIYAGMINYLEKNLFRSDKLDGRFWYYPVQDRKDISEMMLGKIDYYHQMQQVEMHSFAQAASPNIQQLEIINDASRHIIELSKDYLITPYTNSNLYFNGQIHVWGLSSVATGLIIAQETLGSKIDGAEALLKKVISWLKEYAWNGQYFYPVLSKDGIPTSKNYMVRSDAWVFNAFSFYYKSYKDETVVDIVEKCFSKMEQVDFSGRESHALGFRQRILGNIIKLMRR